MKTGITVMFSIAYSFLFLGCIGETGRQPCKMTREPIKAGKAEIIAEIQMLNEFHDFLVSRISGSNLRLDLRYMGSVAYSCKPRGLTPSIDNFSWDIERKIEGELSQSYGTISLKKLEKSKKFQRVIDQTTLNFWVVAKDQQQEKHLFDLFRQD